MRFLTRQRKTSIKGFNESNNFFDSNYVRRYQSIDVTLTSEGKVMLPDQSQLRQMFIDSVELLPPNICASSAQTGSSNVPTLADLQNLTITFVRGSDSIMENIPLLRLNPITDTNYPSVQQKPVFVSQRIDWNQCYITVNANMSAADLVISLGVYYYDPKKPIVTD